MRLRTMLRGASLDDRLAAGAPPGANRALATRAEELVAGKSRRALARQLEDVVQRASSPLDYEFTAALFLNREAIGAAQVPLLELAARLDGSGPVNARGVAMTSRLLRAAESPIYRAYDIPLEPESARLNLQQLAKAAAEGL
ncbi:MAG: hypothetical protein EXQ70_02970 [Solirubrobacterales bacterium]|nr:hypothetical protein [Solirubrobacterales bacterium]